MADPARPAGPHADQVAGPHPRAAEPTVQARSAPPEPVAAATAMAHQLQQLLGRHRPRLLAWLAARHGLAHLAEAEDALQHAGLQALRTWPRDGLPTQPEAWLLTTARHHLLDGWRRRRPTVPLDAHADGAAPGWQPEGDGPARGHQGHQGPAAWPAALGAMPGPADADHPDTPWRRADEAATSAAPQRLQGELADDELALLFAACHPALPPASQLLLALRCLTTLDLATLADALLATEAGLAQRLQRARRQLAGLPLAVPAGAELAPRREAVFSTLWVMFGEGMKASGRQGDRQAGLALARPLCWEAMRLARALAAHTATADGQADALAALLLLHGARLSGRLDEHGELVSLPGQARERWDAGLLRLAHHHLRAAQRSSHLSRWHLLAAIASEHAAARNAASIRWDRIVRWYDSLLRLDPSAAPRLGQAIALAEAGEPQRALGLLQALADAGLPEALRPHHHAALARAHGRLGDLATAHAWFDRAIALARHPADARLLARQQAALHAKNE